MGSKIGLILSIAFIFSAFILGTDLIMIQATYSMLDSMTTFINYNISKSGTITDNLKNYVQENTGAELYCLENNKDKIFQDGETFEYYLKKDYKPIVLSETISISIKRFAVVNIYG